VLLKTAVPLVTLNSTTTELPSPPALQLAVMGESRVKVTAREAPGGRDPVIVFKTPPTVI
jgi:hypothetical protein